MYLRKGWTEQTQPGLVLIVWLFFLGIYPNWFMEALASLMAARDELAAISEARASMNQLG